MDPSPDFTAAADRLYAVPPAEFVATRDAEVLRAHDEGRHDEARALGKLRRPTQSAWLVNVLVRERLSLIEELLALGGDFRTAYEHGSGDRMREVSGRRQRLVSTLVRDARQLGGRVGVRMSADTSRDVEGTLGAALADPAVADEVRQGRLTGAVPYAGFGPAWPTSTAPTAEARAASAARKSSGSEAEADGSAAGAAASRHSREAEERKRRDEERVATARATVAEAEQELDERDQALQSATRRRDRVRAELDRLHDKIRDTQERLEALDRGVRAESKRRQRAADGLATARRGLDSAARRAK